MRACFFRRLGRRCLQSLWAFPLLLSATAKSEFSYSGTWALRGSVDDLLHADFNQDGRDDLLAVQRFNKQFTVYLNRSDVALSFEEIQSFQNIELHKGKLMDFNHDGYQDLVAALKTTNDPFQSDCVVGWFQGNGNGTLGNLQCLFWRYPFQGEIIDLVVNQDSTLGVNHIYLLQSLNTGSAPDYIRKSILVLSPQFAGWYLLDEQTIENCASQRAKNAHLHLADLDGDLKREVIFANAPMVNEECQYGFQIFGTDAEGLNLQFRSKINGFHFRESLIVQDVNGDGRKDLVVPGFGDEIWTLEGRPSLTDLTWTPSKLGGATMDRYRAYAGFLFDYDGDGSLDYLSTDLDYRDSYNPNQPAKLFGKSNISNPASLFVSYDISNIELYPTQGSQVRMGNFLGSSAADLMFFELSGKVHLIRNVHTGFGLGLEGDPYFFN